MLKDKVEFNLLSVIIPVYNRDFSINRCIASVLNQTILPKEIIVIDDFSTDSTVAKLNTYKDQITGCKFV